MDSAEEDESARFCGALYAALEFGYILLVGQICKGNCCVGPANLSITKYLMKFNSDGKKKERNLIGSVQSGKKYKDNKNKICMKRKLMRNQLDI